MPGRPPAFVPVSTGENPGTVLLEAWMRSHEGPVRMTTAQRNALAATSKTPGLQIFNTSTNQMNYWNGAAWVAW